MRLLVIILFLAQLAVQHSSSLPVSTSHAVVDLSCSNGLLPIAKVNDNILPKEAERDAAFVKRAPPPKKTPKAMEPMSLKQAHGKMIKANAISAGRESGAGFIGAFKTVGYGMQQGYHHAKQAYHQFGKGNVKQGFNHVAKVLGKTFGGVILAPVPLVSGLYTGAKRIGHVFQHTYKYVKTPKAQKTTISPTDIRTIEAQLKYNTPTRDWSKKYVRDRLRYTPPS